MKTRKIVYITCSIIGLLYILSSCTKDDIKQQDVPYLFRPINFAVSINKTVATITWAPVDSAKSYTIQISNDSLKFENIVISDSIKVCTYVVELAGNTRYSARVRANASTLQKSSKFNETLTFKTPSENIFNGFSSFLSDQGTVTVNWLPGATVTQLKFSSPGKPDILVPVLDNDKTAGIKICTGLPVGLYTIGLYNSDRLRGTTVVTVEGDYFVKPGDDLGILLTTVTKDSAVIVLKPGIYNLGSATTSLTRNIKFKGFSQNTPTIICMTGSATATAKMFDIGITSRLNFIRFENIEFSGYLDGVTSGAVKIGYLFNQSTACNVGELSFQNCIIRNLGNTPFRIQTAAVKTIDSLKINQCRIYDIGFASVYAIVNMNNATGCTVSNINITNSSIYNFAGSLILNNSSNANAITVQNCTFNQINNIGTNASIRYFIDFYNATTPFVVSNGITVKNCVFGSTPSAFTEGIRVNTITSTSISGSFYTNDYNDNHATTTFSIMGSLTPYAGSSTDLFTDPANGNFTFKDNSFAGRSSAGDPKWFK